MVAGGCAAGRCHAVQQVFSSPQSPPPTPLPPVRRREGARAWREPGEAADRGGTRPEFLLGVSLGTPETGGDGADPAPPGAGAGPGRSNPPRHLATAARTPIRAVGRVDGPGNHGAGL